MDKLALLKSDLRDTSDPKVLAKYPHLASPVLIDELKCKIEVEEERLRKGAS